MATKKLPADHPYLRPIRPSPRTPEQVQERAERKAERARNDALREERAAQEAADREAAWQAGTAPSGVTINELTSLRAEALALVKRLDRLLERAGPPPAKRPPPSPEVIAELLARRRRREGKAPRK